MGILTRRDTLTHGLAFTGIGTLGGLALASLAQTPDAVFWNLLREGGCAVLMRHAQTVPGVGDPPGFRLGDCSTQRNLSAEGREQARRIGQAFIRENLVLGEVRTSAWCRCVETAQLAFGRHTVWPALNSFFQAEGRERQTQAVLATVIGLKPPHNLMLVTHQVNITALTGEFLAMGDLLATRIDPRQTGRLQVLARWAA